MHAAADVKQALGITWADMELLKGQADDIRSEALADDSYSVSNLMEAHLEQYAKTIWFLSSTLK